MATETMVPVLELDEDEELEETMAKSDKLVEATKPKKPAKKPVKDPVVAGDPLVIAVPKKQETKGEVMVPVLLPELPDSGSDGLLVDQYEHVTIANEAKENCYKVLRGSWVDVPVSVYLALKAKYPKI